MIYYVEDDKSIRELVVYTLQNTGFKAVGFENGEKFFNSLQNTKPKLIFPPKISFTPPKVLSTPANTAHSIPPMRPASIPRTMMSAGGRPVVCSRRRTQVVSTAPRTIWPSTPMFHSPAAKVTSTPAEQRSRGTHATRTSEKLVSEPTAPWKISL